jgi:hypothetical protein
MTDSNDVTGTLAELEQKLRELERELTSIGRRRARPEAPVGQTPAAELPPEESLSHDAEVSPVAAPSPAPEVRIVDEALEPAVTFFEAPPEVARRMPPPEPAPPTGFESPMEDFGGEPRRPTEAQLASLAELRRFRDRMERLTRDLTDEYDALLSRVMAGITGGTRGLLAPTPPVASTPPPPLAPQPPLAPPPPPPVAPPPPAPPRSPYEEALFEGHVELGVGPFDDIASLSSFEQRLASLPAASDVLVRRFEASHAVIDVRLATPVALVRELHRVLGVDFSVRQVAGRRVSLTFDG